MICCCHLEILNNFIFVFNSYITGWHYLCFMSSSLRDPGWQKLSLCFYDTAKVQYLVYTCWIFHWPKQVTWWHLNLKGWGYVILPWSWRTKTTLWLELMTTTESDSNLWGCEPWGGWSFRFNNSKLQNRALGESHDDVENSRHALVVAESWWRQKHVPIL